MLLQAVVSLPYSTGLPRDVAQTTWNFDALGVDLEEDCEQIRDDLIQWWNVVATPATNPVCYYIPNPVIVRNACEIAIYDRTNPPAGPPLFTYTWTLGASATNSPSLPLEIALCNSYRAAPIPGVAAARLRGRNYIGPFNFNAMDATFLGLPRPNPDLVTAITQASLRLASKETQPIWSQWSRVRDNWGPVVAGFCNNEWDTQRRREADETARTKWNTAV